jgi:hypothetical protein
VYKIQAATDPEIPLRNKSRRVIAAREFAAESAKSRPPQIPHPLPPELQPPPFSQAAAGRPDHARSHAARCRLRKAKQSSSCRAPPTPYATHDLPRAVPPPPCNPRARRIAIAIHPVRADPRGASSGGNCHGPAPAPALRPPAPPPRRAPGPPLP